MEPKRITIPMEDTRRDCKGETNQSEIAKVLHVDRSIVCRDVAYLRQQAKENITKYVDERLPEEYEKCLVGLNSILKVGYVTNGR
jgi:hypothetical protein